MKDEAISGKDGMRGEGSKVLYYDDIKIHFFPTIVRCKASLRRHDKALAFNGAKRRSFLFRSATMINFRHCWLIADNKLDLLRCRKGLRAEA